MEFGHCPTGPKHVRHERASSGAKLGKTHRPWRLTVEPGLRKCQPQEFAEHLADFWRGGEVAWRAEGIARGIVSEFGMQQTVRHVVRHGHWAGVADSPDEAPFEFGHPKTRPLRSGRAFFAGAAFAVWRVWRVWMERRGTAFTGGIGTQGRARAARGRSLAGTGAGPW